MLGNHWLRKSNLLFSWSAWTTVQVSQCPSFGIFLWYIGKMDYLAPRAVKRLSWAFEANRRQIHVFYGVIVSGLTPGSWDWATYLSAKWSAEDQDIIYLPYCIEDILMRNKCHSTTNRGWNLIFFHWIIPHGIAWNPGKFCHRIFLSWNKKILENSVLIKVCPGIFSKYFH